MMKGRGELKGRGRALEVFTDLPQEGSVILLGRI
jgi:hypothetical protein